MDDSARFYLPSVDDVHEGWIASLLECQGTRMNVLLQGAHARRQVSGMLLEAFDLPQHRPLELSGVCAWLLMSPAAQRRLARQLAVAAHAIHIRRAINKDEVAAMLEQLGEQAYQRALRSPVLQSFVSDGSPLGAQWLMSALACGRAKEYLTALGAALLELTVAEDDTFARIRMRFAFSPSCWRRRPTGLDAERSTLQMQVLEFVDHE